MQVKNTEFVGNMISVFLQSILPFLFYIVLQIPVFFAGMCIVSGREKRIFDKTSVMKTYMAGQMTAWAVLHILAAVMIQCRLKFTVLFLTYLIVMAVLAVWGCRLFIQNGKQGVVSLKPQFTSLSPMAVFILITAVALITLQFLAYYLGYHLDQDDARWLAEANDALVHGDMMTRNFSTGEYLGYFVTSKDTASPWPMFIAIVAKILHVNVAAAAHTIYAPAALLLSYAAYMLIGCELFKKTEARLTFLLSVAVINLFYAGTTYTQSVFTMVRIWQGKATVAGVILPFLVYLVICLNKRDETRDWILMAVTGCAACLMSGMGISMAGIVIALGGAYSILVYRRWKRIPLYLLALAPTACSTLLYFWLRGVI